MGPKPCNPIVVLETYPVDVECPGDDYLPWGFGAYGTVLYIQGSELCFEVLHGFSRSRQVSGLCSANSSSRIACGGKVKRSVGKITAPVRSLGVHLHKNLSVGADPTTRSKCLE